MIGKGIFSQMNESKMLDFSKLSVEEMIHSMEQWQKEDDRRRKERNEVVKSNVKALLKRSKELKKPVPDEVLVITYLNQPVGSWFFERYKEWI